MNNQKRIYLALVFALIFHSNSYGWNNDIRPSYTMINREVNLLYKYPDLWKYLLAEAVGEGSVGLKAVCCVVRNRARAGLSLGLVGAKKRNLEAFVRKCGVSWQTTARDIVLEVLNDNCPDITNGALYFESVDYPQNIKKFDKIHTRVWKYKKHIFYR